MIDYFKELSIDLILINDTIPKIAPTIDKDANTVTTVVQLNNMNTTNIAREPAIVRRFINNPLVDIL